MGTHPIFESDFDCLTECFLESPVQSPVCLLDSTDMVLPRATSGSATLFQLPYSASCTLNLPVLRPQLRSLPDGNISPSSPRSPVQMVMMKKKKKTTNKSNVGKNEFALNYLSQHIILE